MLRTTSPWWMPGVLLVLFGVTIIVFPELLALMVASAFVLAGALWLSIGYAARKAQRDIGTSVIRYERWFQR